MFIIGCQDEEKSASILRNNNFQEFVPRTNSASSVIDTFEYTFTEDTLTVSGFVSGSWPDEGLIIAYRDTQYYKFEISGSKLILFNNAVDENSSETHPVKHVGMSRNSHWEVTDVKNDVVFIDYLTAYDEITAETKFKRIN